MLDDINGGIRNPVETQYQGENVVKAWGNEYGRRGIHQRRGKMMKAAKQLKQYNVDGLQVHLHRKRCIFVVAEMLDNK